MVGRNDLCPCHSGKKYKHCCLLKQQAQPAAPATQPSANTALMTLLKQAAQHYDAQRLPQAEASCRQALALAPHHPDGLHLLGMIALRMGDTTQAAALFARAVAAAVTPSAIMHTHLGIAQQALNQLDAAAASYRQAITLMPGFATAHNNLGQTLRDMGRLDESLASCQQSIRLQAGDALAHANLAATLHALGRFEEAVASYRQAQALNPAYIDAHVHMLWTLQYMQGISQAEVFREHQRFAQKFTAPLQAGWLPHDNVPDTGRRLRIGYVSGDFRDHPIANFFEPILANHDKRRVEIFCYYSNSVMDVVSERIKQLADHWTPCVALSDAALAARIRQHGIDILVDLSGHTALNRLLVFARKPAPVQVTWLGFPGTTGMAAMDYRLTDAVLDPVGVAEPFHTEVLIRLPGSAAFKPSPDSPPVNALPALSTGRITLACLNNLVKINPQVLRLWARVLAALPTAQLMLGNVTSEEVRARLVAACAEAGIAESRLLLMPKLPLAEYLALHQQIDLALDPFPYGGGTTSNHSLWMGVPVVTLAGASTASRQGAAVLTAAGLSELIASSEEEYVKLAVALASDLPRLGEMRQSLRARMSSAASGAEPVQLTRSLEQAYGAIWEQWCRQQKG